MSEYVAELRKLSEHCKFEAFLDDALRDRFVCGLRSEAAQKKLLFETDLTFAKAIEIAQGIDRERQPEADAKPYYCRQAGVTVKWGPL